MEDSAAAGNIHISSSTMKVRKGYHFMQCYAAHHLPSPSNGEGRFSARKTIWRRLNRVSRQFQVQDARRMPYWVPPALVPVDPLARRVAVHYEAS